MLLRCLFLFFGIVFIVKKKGRVVKDERYIGGASVGGGGATVGGGGLVGPCVGVGTFDVGVGGVVGPGVTGGGGGMGVGVGVGVGVTIRPRLSCRFLKGS